MENREIKSNEWQIVTVKVPTQLARGGDETWIFNPNTRYILNSKQVKVLSDGGFVESISPLKSSRNYRQLLGSARIHDAKILIERYRDSGIGDLLFLTGPLRFFYDMSGGSCKIDFYTLSDRGPVLAHHPALPYGPLAGPTLYDSLPLYTYHWFIDQVTENDEEPDQQNVYDALYQQIGLDPEKVQDRYKRPTMTLTKEDFKDVDGIYMLINQQHGVDLRQTPHYVVSPLSNSSLRSASYGMWLQVITELAKARPVLVLGHVGGGQVPYTDMAFGTFNHELSKLGQGGAKVLNLLGATPLRTCAALITRSQVVVSLDSGLLYVAQALRVPAVSIWGTHAPHVRLKYDPMYMKLAIWNRHTCPHSPCFAYSAWPRHKCPRGQEQVVCEVLGSVQPADVVDKVIEAEQLPR